jgi:hypothetical protein
VADAVPLGAILPFYGNEQQLPTDYLFCHGGAIAKTSYPELYGHLVTANPLLRVDEERALLPDLRGEFLRGWDYDGSIDPKRHVGSWQADEIKAHDHEIPYNVQVWWPGHGSFASGRDQGDDQNVANPQTKLTGGKETRPRNVAVAFIIRAKP